MNHAGNLFWEAFVNGVNEELFVNQEFIDSSMSLLTEDDQVFSVLEILSSHTDFLYT